MTQQKNALTQAEIKHTSSGFQTATRLIEFLNHQGLILKLIHFKWSEYCQFKMKFANKIFVDFISMSISFNLNGKQN